MQQVSTVVSSPESDPGRARMLAKCRNHPGELGGFRIWVELPSRGLGADMSAGRGQFVDINLDASTRAYRVVPRGAMSRSEPRTF